MNKFAPLLFAGALAAIPANATTTCDDVAAKLRADKGFTHSGSTDFWPVDVLAKQGFVELATSSHAFDYQKGDDAYIALLANDYGMDEKLAETIRKTAGFMQEEVWSLSASPVHAFMDSFGTADCQTFVFFQDGHRLPDPPDAMWGGMTDYASEPITECYMSQGVLARMGGKVAFVVTDRDVPYSLDLDLRVATLENGQWNAACRVEAKFQMLYRAKIVHRPADGPLPAATIRALASQIAHTLDRAHPRPPAEQKPFALGPAVPKRERERLFALAKDMPVRFEPIPSFADKPDEETNIANGADDLPMMIEGKPYLVRIGHPGMGWRDFEGYSAIFYREKGDGLEAVASAAVEAARGKLTAIKAVAAPPASREE